MGYRLWAPLQVPGADSDYPAQLQVVFPEGVTADSLAKAIASFERVLLLGGSRVDLFRRGDVPALNDSERHGLWLYESRGRCWRCHSGGNFSDEEFHNSDVSWAKQPIDLGRFPPTHPDANRGQLNA